MMDAEKLIQLHQAVHGYNRGHELLSSSLELDQEDADQLSHLTDLSGLPVSDEIPPYLTCYPLPSGKFYALGRTWLDSESSRAGCVLTHTLLIPTAIWGSNLRAKDILCLHMRPSRSSLERFCSTIPLSPIHNHRVDFDRRAPEGLDDFIQLYFGQGKTPVVWLDQGENWDEFLASLFDFLWPSIRKNFSVCTHALQIRTNGSQRFDLLIAPPQAMSRFSRVPKENIIGYSYSRPQPVANISRSNNLIKLVRTGMQYFHQDFHLLDIYRRLSPTLPNDPTALQKIAMLDELRWRASETPAAAVAVLDVLGAIAPGVDEAIEEKGEAIRFAVTRAEATEAALCMELLAAIVQRCARRAFRSFRKLRRELVWNIAGHVAKHPITGLELLAKARVRRGDLTAAVARGLMDAVPEDLLALHMFGLEAPDKLRALLRREPDLLGRYLKGAHINNGDIEAATEDVETWYLASAPRTRRTLARSLYSSPLIGQRPSLLQVLFEEAQSSDIEVILTSLLDSNLGESAWHEIQRLVQKFPAEAESYLHQHGVRNQRSCQLLAESLPLGASALSAIESLTETSQDECIAIWTFCAFINRRNALEAVGTRLTATSSRWIARLIRHDCEPLNDRLKVIRLLLGAYNNEQLCDVLEPADQQRPIWRSIQREIGTALLYGASRDYIKAPGVNKSRNRWIHSSAVQDSLQRVDAIQLLHELIGQGPNDINQAVGLWQWLADVGPLIPDWSGRVLVQLVEDLFAVTRSCWTSAASSSWCLLLARESERHRGYGLRPLDTQAVQICFVESGLPLSEVLLFTFPQVYQATVAGTARSLFEIFPFYSDWDKGKDLRKKLIESYAHSNWPRGNLALTASRANILPKIVSRALRHGKHQLIGEARDDLRSRGGREEIEVAQQLSVLLHEGTSEDWD